MKSNNFDDIKPGARVTILVPAGQSLVRVGCSNAMHRRQEWKPATGRVVMRGDCGWVLNMGGRFGTPGVCTPDNFVSTSV